MYLGISACCKHTQNAFRTTTLSFFSISQLLNIRYINSSLQIIAKWAKQLPEYAPQQTSFFIIVFSSANQIISTKSREFATKHTKEHVFTNYRLSQHRFYIQNKLILVFLEIQNIFLE